MAVTQAILPLGKQLLSTEKQIFVYDRFSHGKIVSVKFPSIRTKTKNELPLTVPKVINYTSSIGKNPKFLNQTDEKVKCTKQKKSSVVQHVLSWRQILRATGKFILSQQPRDKTVMLPLVCWWLVQQKFFSKNLHKKGFSSQRRETLLF